MPDKLDLMTIGQASEYLGVSIDTLRRWEKKGKLESYRSPGGHRYFKKNDLDSVFGRKYERASETHPRIRKIEEKILQEPSEISLIDRKEDFKIIDRPVREINIPETPVVRVARDNVALETSILQPANQLTQVPPVREAQKLEIDKKTKLIIITIIVVAILSIIIFLFWRSSQTILSPVP